MVQHKSQYKIWKNLEKGRPTRSCNIFEKYGFYNCQIVLLENVNATNYNDLVSREAHYIRSLECVNKVIPMRTDKEYYDDNIKYYKQYYKDNKDKIKQYYEDNKDKLIEYREANKEKIKEYQKQIFICVCGSKCIIGKKQRHLKTIKHLKFLESNVY